MDETRHVARRFYWSPRNSRAQVKTKSRTSREPCRFLKTTNVYIFVRQSCIAQAVGGLHGCLRKIRGGALISCVTERKVSRAGAKAGLQTRRALHREVWKQRARRHTRTRAVTRENSLLRTRSRFSIVLLFPFLSLRFPSNLSVGRISAEVRALWMARVSSTPLFPFRVFHSALLFPRVCFQTSASVSVQLVISHPNCRRVPPSDERARANLDEFFAECRGAETKLARLETYCRRDRAKTLPSHVFSMAEGTTCCVFRCNYP